MTNDDTMMGDRHQQEHTMAMSDAERAAAYRRRNGATPRPPRKHGTSAAYTAHYRAGEPYCDACKAWKADYMREQRAKAKASKTGARKGKK